MKSTFLHGELQEQVFIDEPPSYVNCGSEHKVYRLKKALYGLKQAPRAWYSHIDAYFNLAGFKKCLYEHTLYMKVEDEKIVIICLYVDDLIYTGNNQTLLDKLKQSMTTKFDMSDLGFMHYFLGIEVKQFIGGIFISQKKYAQESLDRFGMKNCNSVTTPTEMGLKLEKNLVGKNIDNILCK